MAFPYGLNTYVEWQICHLDASPFYAYRKSIGRKS